MPCNDVPVKASGFESLSAMPVAYFEKMQAEYPTSDVGALRVFLAFRAAARRIETVVAAWLESHGLTATKIDVLHLVSVSAKGTSIARLREQLLMTQPNVAFVVTGLERDGLVRRLPDPNDGRATLVRLTPAGRRLIAAMTGSQLEAIAAATADVTPAKREAFIDLLAAITLRFEATSRP